MLEKKGERSWKDPVEIPDSEIVKYFEDEKKAAWRKVKKDEKQRKAREAEKLKKEQDLIVAKKEKKMRDDEIGSPSSLVIKEVSPLRKFKDKVVGLMYNNPQIFKANTVIQILNKMKKEGADEGNLTSENSHKRLGREGISNYQFAKQVGIL